MDITLEFFDSIAMMKIEGVITSDNAHEFQAKLKDVLNSDVTLLELDFSLCRNISSSGIGKLLIFYKEFLNNKGEIEVIKSSPTVYELFTTIKLNQLFTVNL